MTHPNDVRRYSLTPAELDRHFANTSEAQVRARDERLRAEAWPSEVNALLASMAEAIIALRARVEQLEGRGA